jgi:hypothetical protein
MMTVEPSQKFELSSVTKMIHEILFELAATAKTEEEKKDIKSILASLSSFFNSNVKMEQKFHLKQFLSELHLHKTHLISTQVKNQIETLKNFKPFKIMVDRFKRYQDFLTQRFENPKYYGEREFAYAVLPQEVTQPFLEGQGVPKHFVHISEVNDNKYLNIPTTPSKEKVGQDNLPIDQNNGLAMAVLLLVAAPFVSLAYAVNSFMNAARHAIQGEKKARSFIRMVSPILGGIAGFIGGATAGSLAGAAIGSVVPGLGTFIGLCIGAFLGGAFGAGLLSVSAKYLPRFISKKMHSEDSLVPTNPEKYQVKSENSLTEEEKLALDEQGFSHLSDEQKQALVDYRINKALLSLKKIKEEEKEERVNINALIKRVTNGERDVQPVPALGEASVVNPPGAYKYTISRKGPSNLQNGEKQERQISIPLFFSEKLKAAHVAGWDRLEKNPSPKAGK